MKKGFNKKNRNKKGKCSYLFKNKKGQGVIGLSFGTIFSIILIIFFVIVAFVVIKAFLGTQKCAQVGIFRSDFQEEITKAWNSPKQISMFKATLPSALNYVCFANFSKRFKGEYLEIGEDISIYEGEDANLFLYPIEKACDIPYHKINHLDLEAITSEKNPYCIMIKKGEVEIEIKKELGDRIVRVE